MRAHWSSSSMSSKGHLLGFVIEIMGVPQDVPDGVPDFPVGFRQLLQDHRGDPHILLIVGRSRPQPDDIPLTYWSMTSWGTTTFPRDLDIFGLSAHMPWVATLR